VSVLLPQLTGIQSACAVLYGHQFSVWLCHIWYVIFIKNTIFEKKIIEHSRFGLIFSTILFATFLILRRIQRDIIINVYTSSCKTRITILMGCGSHPTTDTITLKVYCCHHFGQHHDIYILQHYIKVH